MTIVQLFAKSERHLESFLVMLEGVRLSVYSVVKRRVSLLAMIYSKLGGPLGGLQVDCDWSLRDCHCSLTCFLFCPLPTS